jgi:hypothetical protein
VPETLAISGTENSNGSSRFMSMAVQASRTGTYSISSGGLIIDSSSFLFGGGIGGGGTVTLTTYASTGTTTNIAGPFRSTPVCIQSVVECSTSVVSDNKWALNTTGRTEPNSQPAQGA